MSKKFAEHMREDRRLQILLCLVEGANYSASHYLLRHCLDGFGHESSMDTLKGDIAWLEEAGLVDTSEFEGATVVRLTQRGLDVAQNRAQHPGVKRPQPE